ncbi:MAG: DUF2798 domain-containing protein [Lachnospirales bacterium]
MPQNKRESLIFTFIMCFFMVLVMSVYNTAMFMGGLSVESIQAAWLGFPIAYIFAMCCDWFIVSKLAKGFAFGVLLKPEDSNLKKVICVSSCMVVPMVIIMSLYGAIEMSTHMGSFDGLLLNWGKNIIFNFIVALPLQLLVVGPLTRKIFRTAFPVGKVLD